MPGVTQVASSPRARRTNNWGAGKQQQQLLGTSIRASPPNMLNNGKSGLQSLAGQSDGICIPASWQTHVMLSRQGQPLELYSKFPSVLELGGLSHHVRPVGLSIWCQIIADCRPNSPSSYKFQNSIRAPYIILESIPSLAKIFHKNKQYRNASGLLSVGDEAAVIDTAWDVHDR